MNESVLIVAAHPDDEVLGCGGTIAAHAAAGDVVHIMFLADGESSRGGGDEAAIAARQERAREAASILGAETPRFLGLPDNRLDSVPLLDVIKRVEAVVEEVNPTVVYTHHRGDLNIDHRIAFQATVTACRPQPGAPVRAIYCFEALSSTEWAAGGPGEQFQPTLFVDIRRHLPEKMRALASYGKELRPFPHPRSPEAVVALARLRGASAGIEAAESFMVVRRVVA
jgi:LmbE family N-acetylglucosaminyl deacetylase